MLYIRDHGGLGFNITQKSASHFLYNILAALVRHIGVAKPKNLQPFQQVIKFLKILSHSDLVSHTLVPIYSSSAIISNHMAVFHSKVANEITESQKCNKKVI